MKQSNKKRAKAKRQWKRYPHIPLLTSLKPSPRMLLGQRLFWTEKKDGECVTIWLNDNNKIVVSSRNQENAAPDIQQRVRNCEDYPKVIELLKENPQFIIYVESCKKGRSVTGIEVFTRDTLFLFDIFDIAAEKFLYYVNVHQHAYHHKIPVVGLFAETRHRTMTDLLKFKNHVLEHCEAVKLEGMVIKAYKIPERFQGWREFKGSMVQAKVKLDVPEPIQRKISKGEAIYPTIPDNEIFGAISKVEADFGLTGEPKDDMPRIAEYVKQACQEHFFSNPKKKLIL